jgi:hypothetical protein
VHRPAAAVTGTYCGCCIHLRVDEGAVVAALSAGDLDGWRNTLKDGYGDVGQVPPAGPAARLGHPGGSDSGGHGQGTALQGKQRSKDNKRSVTTAVGYWWEAW